MMLEKKRPCSLYKIFCILGQYQCIESVEPWYGQIKEIADGADKWFPEMHRAVVFGMYPELEKPAKEFSDGYGKIWDEYNKSSHKNEENLH